MGENPTKAQIRRAKHRTKGLPCTLTYEEMGDPPDHCPCCGERMERYQGVRSPRRHCPTLERLVPEDGYVAGNVIWLCWHCNTTKGSLDVADLYRVADFFHDQYKQRGIPCPTRGKK